MMVRHCATNGSAEINEMTLAIKIFTVVKREDMGSYAVRSQGGREVNPSGQFFSFFISSRGVLKMPTEEILFS